MRNLLAVALAIFIATIFLRGIVGIVAVVMFSDALPEAREEK